MWSEIIFFVRVVFACLISCTAGFFFSLIVSKVIMFFVSGSDVGWASLIYWAIKKSSIAGPIAAAWVVVFIYADRYFDKREKD